MPPDPLPVTCRASRSDRHRPAHSAGRSVCSRVVATGRRLRANGTLCLRDQCRRTNRLRVLFRRITGALSPLAGSPFAVGAAGVGAGADPLGSQLYAAGGSTVAVLSLNPSTGVLAPIDGSPFSTGGNGAQSVLVDPSGRFLYLSNVVDRRCLGVWRLHWRGRTNCRLAICGG